MVAQGLGERLEQCQACVEVGYLGRFAQGQQAEQVANGLVQLLRDDSLRAQMGSAARARAVREFRYDVLTDRLECALDGVR